MQRGFYGERRIPLYLLRLLPTRHLKALLEGSANLRADVAQENGDGMDGGKEIVHSESIPGAGSDSRKNISPTEDA